MLFIWQIHVVNTSLQRCNILLSQVLLFCFITSRHLELVEFLFESCTNKTKKSKYIYYNKYVSIYMYECICKNSTDFQCLGDKITVKHNI